MNYIIVKADHKVDPKFREEIIAIIKDLSNLIGMSEWSICVKINKNPSNNRPIDGMSTAANVNTNWTYKDAFINIYPELYKEWKLETDKYALQFALCHELCHCLLEKLSLLAQSRFVTQPEINSEIEHLNQAISRIICKLHYDITEDKYTNTNCAPIPSPDQYGNCSSELWSGPKQNRKPNSRRQRKNRRPKDGKETSGNVNGRHRSVSWR